MIGKGDGPDRSLRGTIANGGALSLEAGDVLRTGSARRDMPRRIMIRRKRGDQHSIAAICRHSRSKIDRSEISMMVPPRTANRFRDVPLP